MSIGRVDAWPLAFYIEKFSMSKNNQPGDIKNGLK